MVLRTWGGGKRVWAPSGCRKARQRKQRGGGGSSLCSPGGRRCEGIVKGIWGLCGKEQRKRRRREEEQKKGKREAESAEKRLSFPNEHL